MLRIAVVLVLLAFGGCKYEGNGGSKTDAKLQLSDIDVQKAGIEFFFSIEILVGGKTVTTGDIANTGVTVQWKCAEEKYTDENQVQAKIENGKAQVKITIGKVDDLEDRTDCKIKAVAKISDKEIEIESQVFVVKAQTIKISLMDGNKVLGAKISDVIIGIKNDQGDVALDKATVSISDGCRDVKLVRWLSSDENSPTEVGSSSADAQDVYLASNKWKVGENCVLIVSIDEKGEKFGAVSLSDKGADYVVISVIEPSLGQMQIDLKETTTETGNYKLYLVYNDDDKENKWYKPTSDGGVGFAIANGVITLSNTEIPDSFYYKIEDRVLIWVYEPTILKEIAVLENEGLQFTVKYLSEEDKIVLENTAAGNKCDAVLYQARASIVEDTATAVSYSVGAETYPVITTEITGGQIKFAKNLFIIGNHEHCELMINGKAIGSFASEAKASGITVSLEDKGNTIKITANYVNSSKRQLTYFFVLDDSSYINVEVDNNTLDATYTKREDQMDGVEEALVRAYASGGGIFLVRKTMNSM